jgi:hypothetical protein
MPPQRIRVRFHNNLVGRGGILGWDRGDFELRMFFYRRSGERVPMSIPPASPGAHVGALTNPGDILGTEVTIAGTVITSPRYTVLPAPELQNIGVSASTDPTFALVLTPMDDQMEPMEPWSLFPTQQQQQQQRAAAEREPLSETSGGSHNEGLQSANPRVRTPVAIVLAEPSTCEEAAESFQQNMSEWCTSTRRRAEWEATLEKLQQGCKGRTDRTMTAAVADESRLARKRMGRTTYVLTLRGSVLVSSKNQGATDRGFRGLT